MAEKDKVNVKVVVRCRFACQLEHYLIFHIIDCVDSYCFSCRGCLLMEQPTHADCCRLGRHSVAVLDVNSTCDADRQVRMKDVRDS